MVPPVIKPDLTRMTGQLIKWQMRYYTFERNNETSFEGERDICDLSRHLPCLALLQ
jgi:hypothetical protein